MSAPRDPDRRSFLRKLGSITGGSVLAAQMPALLATMDLACTAQDAQAPLRVFDAPGAAFVEAVAARIIPTDHRPGAREAGVIHFIDMALDRLPPFTGADQLISEMRQDLEAQAGRTFETLPEGDQDALLETVEDHPAFGVLRFLTVAGFLVHPSRGGNRDKVGWQLIGFDDRHAWLPPFGYYDAEVEG